MYSYVAILHRLTPYACDAQLKSLLVNEGGVHPARLVSVLHYDGSPISARFIIKDITEKLQAGHAALRENAE